MLERSTNLAVDHSNNFLNLLTPLKDGKWLNFSPNHYLPKFWYPIPLIYSSYVLSGEMLLESTNLAC